MTSPIVDVSLPHDPFERRGTWAMTVSGRRYWPADPRPGDVCIGDIAHHLSLISRFGGATLAPYSVAQHSVLVSFLCKPEHALIGLLHDAPEAYLGDVIRALKRELAPLYKPLETRWAAAIAIALGLPADALVNLPADVVEADHQLLVAERRDLLPETEWPETSTWTEAVVPLPWKLAKAVFESRLIELGGQLP